jgi:hypothetical protein
MRKLSSSIALDFDGIVLYDMDQRHHGRRLDHVFAFSSYWAGMTAPRLARYALFLS